MKGLILAGGAGTRLRPITHTSAKQLVPIANKPILFYVVEQMAAAGMKEIGVVVSPDPTGAAIEAALGDGSAFGVELTFIAQAEPLGLAHCVLIARDFLGDDDFVMYLGDNMLQQPLRPLVDRFLGERSRQLELHEPTAQLPAAEILLAHVDDPSRFGVAAVDKQGRRRCTSSRSRSSRRPTSRSSASTSSTRGSTRPCARSRRRRAASSRSPTRSSG